VCCNIPFFISNVVNMGLLCSLINLIRGLLIFSSKNELFCLLDSLYYFLVSNSFVSAFIFIIFPYITFLGYLLLVFLGCIIRLFIWDLSSFLKWVLMVVNFPVKTAFAVCHRFW
jgi:hypothetical protein